MNAQSDSAFFIWSWNSAEWLEECINTFRATTDSFLLGIANAPTDGSDKILFDACDAYTELSNHVSISKCVNIGYEFLYEETYEYIGWIHPDQSFFQHDWVDVLSKTLDTYPQIGKISASNTRLEDPILEAIHPGSEAGNLIRRDTWQLVGPWDESYIGCGGYEDWDYQQKLVSHGLASAITPDALMWHKGMGTRSKRPQDQAYQEAMHNGTIYNNKWNTWEPIYAPSRWVDLSVVK